MDWTTLGDVSLATWKARLGACGSPLLAEARETWEAAKPHSLLCLALMDAMSGCGTIGQGKDRHNPLGLSYRGSYGGFQTFETWTAAVEEWQRQGVDAWAGYDPFFEAGMNAILAKLTALDAHIARTYQQISLFDPEETNP